MLHSYEMKEIMQYLISQCKNDVHFGIRSCPHDTEVIQLEHEGAMWLSFMYQKSFDLLFFVDEDGRACGYSERYESVSRSDWVLDILNDYDLLRYDLVEGDGSPRTKSKGGCPQ